MSKIRMTQPLLDYEGNPIMIQKTDSSGQAVFDDNHQPIRVPETLRSYLIIVLNNVAKDENEAVPAEELAKRYQLSKKLYERNEVQLTSPEKTLLIERAGKIYNSSPLISGRIYDMLEGNEIVVAQDDSEDDAFIVQNADLTNVDPEKPITLQKKKVDGPTE